MRKSIKKVLVILLILFAIMVLPVTASAQIEVIPDGGSGPDAPIDGGLSLLVAAGVGYGAKKLKQKRKNCLKE